MTLPGFTAEAATGPASQPYGYGWPAGLPGGDIVPAALVLQFPLIRCCGYSQLLRRFVCVQQRQRPGQACRCRRTPLGDPFIDCRDLVFTPD